MRESVAAAAEALERIGYVGPQRLTRRERWTQPSQIIDVLDEKQRAMAKRAAAVDELMPIIHTFLR